MSVIIISDQVTSLPRWSSMHCSNFSIYAAGLLLYHLLRQLVQTAGLLTDVFSSLELCFQPVWSPDCMCLIFQVFGKYNRSFKSPLILPDFPLILIVSVISHALKVKHCFTNSTQQNRLFQINNKPIQQTNIVVSDEGDSPATVGQRNGDGAEKQIAFGLADDGLTVGSRGDDHKLSYTIPVNTVLVIDKHMHRQHIILHFTIFTHTVYF